MPIPTNDIDVSFVFDLSDPSTPVIVATDNTDYVSLGYNSGVGGDFTNCASPAGVFYAHANGAPPGPDIAPFTSRVKELPCPVDAQGNPIVGNYSITYSIQTAADGPSAFFIRTFEFDFAWEAHTLLVSQSVNCDASKLVSVAQNVWGPDDTVEAFEHTVDSPEVDGQPVAPPMVTALAQNVVTPIYRSATSPYVTTATATVLFQYTGYSVREELEGTASVKVICRSLCCFAGAISTLYRKYLEACAGNPVQIVPIGNSLLKVDTLITLWNLALQCGDVCDLNSIETQLKSILGDCNCGCSNCEDEDGWVTPVTNSSSTNGGVNLSVSTPLVLNGTALSIDHTFLAEVAANTTAISNLQSQVNNIVQSKYVLLHNDATVSGNAGDANLQSLKAYTLPADTLVNVGDMLVVTAAYTFAQNTNNKVVRVDYGVFGNIISFIGANANPFLATGGFEFKWRITKISPTKVTQEITTTNYVLSPAVIKGPAISEVNDLNSSAAVNIIAYGQSPQAGAANDISCRKLTVELFKA